MFSRLFLTLASWPSGALTRGRDYSFVSSTELVTRSLTNVGGSFLPFALFNPVNGPLPSARSALARSTDANYRLGLYNQSWTRTKVPTLWVTRETSPLRVRPERLKAVRRKLPPSATRFLFFSTCALCSALRARLRPRDPSFLPLLVRPPKALGPAFL
jgi:hypothetical protein